MLTLAANVVTLVSGTIAIWAFLPGENREKIAWTISLFLLVAVWDAWKVGQRRGRAYRLSERRKAQNDLDLVTEWLQDWDIGSEFLRWLREWPVDKRVPHDKILEIEYFVERSSPHTEPRRLSDPDLRRLFTEVRDAADRYLGHVREYMWTADGGPQTETDPDYLQVPIEWDYKKKDKAVADLSAARQAFSQKLQALLAEEHDRLRRLADEA